MLLAEGLIAAIVAILVVITVMRSVRIVPQARARNVERLGRYRKTLEPGLNFVIPMIDRDGARPTRACRAPCSRATHATSGSDCAPRFATSTPDVKSASLRPSGVQ